MYKSDKIIIHGLFNMKLIIALFLQPWLLKKCYWIIWGGDLYKYQEANKTLKFKVEEFIRRSVIKKIGNFITRIKGEYELAQKWYGAKGKYYACNVYVSSYHINYKPKKINHKSINILVGNSADPTNNQIEVFEKLKKFKNDDIKIFAPLSYGDEKNYAEKVIKVGENMFGKKFIPLTKFMEFKEYTDLLSNMDVAIFYHKRQQGMGNVFSLLKLKKKVYIRKGLTTWDFFKEQRIKVFDVENIDLEKIDSEIATKNSDKIKSLFSNEICVNQLKKIFDY